MSDLVMNLSPEISRGLVSGGTGSPRPGSAARRIDRCKSGRPRDGTGSETGSRRPVRIGRGFRPGPGRSGTAWLDVIGVPGRGLLDRTY